MKNPIASLIVATAASAGACARAPSAALATAASAGPDFVTPTPAGGPLASSDGERRIAPADDVLFAYNSHALEPVAQVQLERAAAWMKAHARHHLVLEGYADATGTAVYNEDLATRRAVIVRNHLHALGVPLDRMLLVVFGEEAARGGRHPLDRRVVLYASTRPLRELAAASLERRGALSAAWTVDGTLYQRSREGGGVATR